MPTLNPYQFRDDLTYETWGGREVNHHSAFASPANMSSWTRVSYTTAYGRLFPALPPLTDKEIHLVWINHCHAYYGAGGLSRHRDMDSDEILHIYVKWRAEQNSPIPEFEPGYNEDDEANIAQNA